MQDYFKQIWKLCKHYFNKWVSVLIFEDWTSITFDDLIMSNGSVTSFFVSFFFRVCVCVRMCIHENSINIYWEAVRGFISSWWHAPSWSPTHCSALSPFLEQILAHRHTLTLGEGEQQNSSLFLGHKSHTFWGKAYRNWMLGEESTIPTVLGCVYFLPVALVGAYGPSVPDHHHAALQGWPQQEELLFHLFLINILFINHNNLRWYLWLKGNLNLYALKYDLISHSEIIFRSWIYTCLINLLKGVILWKDWYSKHFRF